jgi:hypothetical protein
VASLVYFVVGLKTGWSYEPAGSRAVRTARRDGVLEPS